MTSSSDAPVTHPNWRQGVQAAVTRRGLVTGKVSGQEQCISVMDAIRTYTISGPWQGNMEDVKGSIEAGKFADLCALEGDILNEDPDKLGNLKVEMTISGGEIVYTDKILYLPGYYVTGLYFVFSITIKKEEEEMAKVRITVVKKLNNKDIFGDNPPVKINESMLTPECHRFEVGQEFVVDLEKNHTHPDSWENVPKGFCVWAYSDIQRDISHILFGGSYPWIAEENVAISCCTDGLRPVIFKIERID